MAPSREVTVLVAEDNLVDQEAIARAFETHRIANRLVFVNDGVETLAVLRGEHARERVERPYLLLLDLNMPRMGGIEVLHELRDDPKLQDTIVFVLTTSKRDEDKVESYRKNVAGYIVKSEVGHGFLNLVNMLDHYWRVVELP